MNVNTEFIIDRLFASRAFSNVDYIFDVSYSNSKSIKIMEDLLGSQYIKDMYRKALLLELETPCNITKLTMKDRLKLISPILLFLKNCKGISMNKQRQQFKVGIMVDHPKNIFAMNYYFLEACLIDEQELPSKDVLFIDETSKINTDDYNKRGYNYVSLNFYRETISKEMFWNKIIRKFIPAYIKIIMLSLSEPPLTFKVTIKILQDYIKWSIFTDNYKLKNYIKKLLPDDISKTIMLSNANVITYLWYPDSTSMDFHLDWDSDKKNQTLFSFMHYDYCVINGKIVKRYLEKHRNSFKGYIETGNPYSQLIKEIRTKNKKNPNITISAFDTTYSDSGPIKLSEGITFVKDILRLMDDFKGVNIIFKGKKEIEKTHPELLEIYNKFNETNGGVFIPRYNERKTSSAEIIASSNLVISCAYTSTTQEALGSKIKAIYYEPGNHDVGDGFMLNRIPNFVAHDYDKLKRLVAFWLYDAKEKYFDEWRNKYFKDEYNDQGAMSRLRNLLNG